MANNLPDLCLQNIFNYLDYDCKTNDCKTYDFKTFDRKTLYSCILVNKQWSYSSIPVLWSNPFIYVSENKNLKPLLDTYLSFLTQDRQQRFGIKPKFYSTMFNYPVYFRHMDLLLIHDCVKYWCNESNVVEKENQICKALIEYFLIHSSKIDTLRINYPNILDILDISSSTQIIPKIQKIQTLVIGDEGSILFLLNLIQNIKSLIFSIPKYDGLVNDLRNFIQYQKNLIDITISQTNTGNLFPIYWEVFHSSKNVTSTITFIEFFCIKFPRDTSLLYHLSFFINLKYLQFSKCDFGMIPNIKEDQFIQEINLNYPLAFKKLNTIITKDSFNLDILKILLQLSGEELMRLELLNVKIIKFTYILKWLEVFCLNLRRLVIIDQSNRNLEIPRIDDFFQKFDYLSYVVINEKKTLN